MDRQTQLLRILSPLFCACSPGFFTLSFYSALSHFPLSQDFTVITALCIPGHAP